MLSIRHIKKTYRTGDLVQKALDDVSLDLRDSEFVAILGPSGSGKTTLLNIIGGLDRYDEGDLIINGVSTKKFTERDWDSYRNHSVGFVFQSYNLIPHQTLLQNVELALTISGISGEERRRRAEEALEAVGLKEQMHKKPAQLSGGQMQRVSLARALVNDPEILLADEPTGALDSETSVQVMDLLKDVAKDRLVVMVTHNPELADDYASRIVRVKDGKILEDSNPYQADETAVVEKKPDRTSMSWLTALQLSLNNLMTKKARTLLVAFAGSIGIIGIAMILSLSTGVNQYISSIEEETLSEYPIQIQKTTSNMMGMMMEQQADLKSGKHDGEVVEMQMITALASGQTTNDLKAFKKYLETNPEQLDQYINAIEYGYDITPQIYRVDSDEIRKVCPDPTMTTIFGSGTSMLSSLMGSSSLMEQFHSLPESPSLYEDQYEIRAGSWPKNENECVVVLDEDDRIADLTLYSLGMRPASELEKILKDLQENKAADEKIERKTWKYSDFLGRSFKVVDAAALYSYDEKFKVWTDRSDNGEFLKKAVDKGRELKVTGVVGPKANTSITMLQSGIYYSPELITTLIKDADESAVVKAQKKTPEINIFTGEKFGAKPKDGMNMENLFTVDEDAFKEAFKVDTSGLNMDASSLGDMLGSGLNMSDMDFDMADLDLGDLLDLDSLTEMMPAFSADTIGQLTDGVLNESLGDALQDVFMTVANDYVSYTKAHPEYSVDNLSQGLETYLNRPEMSQWLEAQLQEIFGKHASSVLTPEMLENLVRQLMQGYTDFALKQADPSDFETNFAAYLKTEAVQGILKQLSGEMQGELAKVQITAAQLQAIVNGIADGYGPWAEENGYASASSVIKGLQTYFESERCQNLLMKEVDALVNTSRLEENIQNVLGDSLGDLGSGMSSQMGDAISAIMNSVASGIQSALTSGMSSLLGGGTDMSDMFSLDPDALAKAFKMNMDEDDFMELMTSMAMAEENSYDNNLRRLGYADRSDPASISIYPVDFEAKDGIDHIIKDYNEEQKARGDEGREITYTDTVGTMMSSVSTIINTISYVLIAFVAVSLIVSSIMIGVITYISVLERRKEIGILRSIGASKRNISEVFNAETFITGLLAGLMGVGITLISLIPINMIIHNLTHNPAINAVLPWQAALLLIGLSVVLTLIGGLIPSSKAANSDPVAALRSE